MEAKLDMVLEQVGRDKNIDKTVLISALEQAILTAAKRTFKIVDLIRQRDSFERIKVPAFPVEVTIEVTTSGMLMTPAPAPSAVFDRLEKGSLDMPISAFGGG